MRLADTSDEARRRQLAAFAAMPPSERVAMAVEMSIGATQMARDAIRRSQPDLTEHEVNRELCRRLHGDRVATLAFPTPT